MHNDLNNPSMTTRFARTLLVAACTVLFFGLAGAGFARSIETRPGIVWFVRGHSIVIPPTVEKTAVEHTSETSEPSQQEEKADESIPSPELLRDAQPELASSVQIPVPAQRIMLMEVTAYCPCTKCCGPNAQGITASGKDVSYNGGKFVAADTRLLPFGTKLLIPGYGDGEAVEVIDRGGAIKGNKLDVYFDSHQEALQWGRQKIEVIIQD